MELKIGGTVLSLKRGDITYEKTDAIVNAANENLSGGGGVDHAIHTAGGPQIATECKAIGVCRTGSAVITGAGRLYCKVLIHAVGPIYRGGRHGEEKLLEGAYMASLRLAVKKKCRSIAFPSISTGAYDYPTDKAARVALSAVISFLSAHEGTLDIVRFVLFSDEDLAIYEEALREIAGG